MGGGRDGGVWARWAGVLAVSVAVAALAGCGIDPAPPTFLGGARPTEGGRVEVRIGTCPAGTLEEVRVDVYDVDDDEDLATPDLWRVRAGPDGGPPVAAEGAVDVVLGSAPAGMVEEVPFEAPLPEGEIIRVSVSLSTNGFGLFFEPGDLAAGSFVLNGEDETIPEEDYGDDLAAICDLVPG